jgi:hypothetical protein
VDADKDLVDVDVDKDPANKTRTDADVDKDSADKTRTLWMQMWIRAL